ncbi:Plasminogen activator inhibitor 1 RNA-binding protein [Trichoplax sp. H2]|nr:Plasminogen activator inhibitor 1 RNA-binding protein [Trichoplax sp. H2]|eukprot:RDD42248.1 Plasminogen activator inhibitor 1 RNA-binding protein [Trichoplax sp. H2]
MEEENNLLQGNRFALLLSTEGEDGGERILRQKKDVKVEKKIATTPAVGSKQKVMDQSSRARSEKTNKAENKTEKRTDRPRTGKREGQNQRGFSNRGRGRGGDRRGDYRQRDEVSNGVGEGNFSEGYRGPRGERGERSERGGERGGGERGGRGRRGGPPRRGRGGIASGSGSGKFAGKREFERRSGSSKTGVKSFEKREGGGTHNWGKPSDDLKADETNQVGGWGDTQEESKNWDDSTEESTNWGDQPAETRDWGDDSENVEDDQEEAISQLTLDEYKQQQAKLKGKPEKNLRRSGENEDQSKWRNTKELEKEEGDDATENAKFERQDRGKRESYRNQKNLTDQVEINLQPRHDGGSRGRGGRRGGRSRGRGRGRGDFHGRNGNDHFNRDRREAAPDVSNELEFPALA